MKPANVTGLGAKPESDAWQSVYRAMPPWEALGSASILGTGFEPLTTPLPWQLVLALCGVFYND